jgi:hypothetical protein
MRLVAGGPDWWLTIVYGPSRDEEKPAFLTELHDLWQVQTGPWILGADFNMIYRAEDKNNNRVIQCLMGQFCHLHNSASLQEAHLNVRLFTWSNESEHPTLEWIYHVFFSNEWEVIFPDHNLQSLASLCSDHSPCCCA